MFILTDHYGRETLILKKTERAVRIAWGKIQRENAKFGMPEARIVSIRPRLVDVPEQAK